MSPLFALALCLAAPPAPAGNDAQLVKDWLRVCKAHVDDYVISPADKPDEKFKMLTDPVFRHTQPVRGDDIGAVWLWVQEDGRPAAIGTVFAYSSGVGGGGYRFVVHEFHSMLDRPLVAMWRGKPQWSTDRAGLGMESGSRPPSRPTRRSSGLARWVNSPENTAGTRLMQKADGGNSA